MKFNDVVKLCAEEGECTPLMARAIINACTAQLKWTTPHNKTWCIPGMGQITVTLRGDRYYNDPINGGQKYSPPHYGLRLVRTRTQRLRDRPR